MKVFFVLKPRAYTGGESATLAKFYDIYNFDGKDVYRFNYSNRRVDGTRVPKATPHAVCSLHYDDVIRIIRHNSPDWIVVHGRANCHFVRHLYDHGFRNLVVWDQDEIFKASHLENIDSNLLHALINVQEHKAIVGSYTSKDRFTWLPPFFERYMEPTCKEKLYDIGFLGYVNAYRRERLTRLFDRVLCSKKRATWKIHDCVEDGMLRGAEAGNFYAACKIVAHIPRVDEKVNPLVNHATSSRMFQVLGTGAFYLMQDNTGIEGLFEPGKHLDVFKTDDEFVAKASYYLRWWQKRERIATTGRKLVYDEHLCTHRAQQFWELLEGYPIPNQTLLPPPKIVLTQTALPKKRLRRRKPPLPSRRTDWK